MNHNQKATTATAKQSALRVKSNVRAGKGGAAGGRSGSNNHSQTVAAPGSGGANHSPTVVTAKAALRVKSSIKLGRGKPLLDGDRHRNHSQTVAVPVSGLRVKSNVRAGKGGLDGGRGPSNHNQALVSAVVRF